MATKSILKNVNIKGGAQTRALLHALEHAEQHRGKEVVLSRSVEEIRGDDVCKFFEKMR